MSFERSGRCYTRKQNFEVLKFRTFITYWIGYECSKLRNPWGRHVPSKTWSGHGQNIQVESFKHSQPIAPVQLLHLFLCRSKVNLWLTNFPATMSYSHLPAKSRCLRPDLTAWRRQKGMCESHSLFHFLQSDRDWVRYDQKGGKKKRVGTRISCDDANRPGSN